jgi:MFS family permease
LEQKQVKRFTISILVLIFGYAFVNNTPSLFMNGIISEFNLFGAEEGSMSSMANLGGLIALIAIPFLQGRIKKWTMLLISGLIQIVLMIFFGFISFYWLLLAAYILLGAGMGWVDSYSNSSIVDINKEKSSKYMGLLHGVYGVGAFISPFIIQALLTVMSWRQVYYILAGFIGITVIFYIIQTRRDGGIKGVSNINEPRLRLKEVTGYLKNRYNLLVIGGGVMFSASQTCVAVWIVRYMTVQYNRADLGAVALSVLWFFSTISRFLAPRINIKPLKMYMIGLAAIGILQACGLLLNTPYALLIAFGGIGLLSGQCMPTIMSEVTKKYPGRTSLPTTVMLFMMYIVRIIMPLVMGIVSAVSSISVSMYLPVLTSALGVLSVFFAMREKNGVNRINEKSVPV